MNLKKEDKERAEERRQKIHKEGTEGMEKIGRQRTNEHRKKKEKGKEAERLSLTFYCKDKFRRKLPYLVTVFHSPTHNTKLMNGRRNSRKNNHEYNFYCEQTCYVVANKS
jgi:hypothetical protein